MCGDIKRTAKHGIKFRKHVKRQICVDWNALQHYSTGE